MGSRDSIGQVAVRPQSVAGPVAGLLLGATLWGVIWYPLRLLEQAGLAGLWTTLILYLAALAVVPALSWGRSLDWSGARRGSLLALALASGWCNVAFILAVLDGAVVRVLLLFYLSPVWAVLLGRVILGERLTVIALATLALALSGAAIMLWDPALGAPWPRDRADWLAASSGFAFALGNVLVRRLQDVPLLAKTAIAWTGVVAVSALGLVLLGVPLPQAGAAPLLGAAALGALGITVMTLAVLYGVTHLPVQRSAVILLFEIVAGALSAYWLAGEVLGAAEWVGGALIVTASWLATRRGSRA